MFTTEQSDVNRAVNIAARDFIQESISSEELAILISQISIQFDIYEKSIRGRVLERIDDYIIRLSPDGINWRKIR